MDITRELLNKPKDLLIQELAELTELYLKAQAIAENSEDERSQINALKVALQIFQERAKLLNLYKINLVELEDNTNKRLLNIDLDALTLDELKLEYLKMMT